MEGSSMTWLRSPLKYPGGKFALLPEIEDLLPENGFDYYFEPFLGGGSVALNLGRHAHKEMYLNDVNGELILFWTMLQLYAPRLLIEIEHLARELSEEAYYEVRTRFNAGLLDSIPRAAAFYYLNRMGFNGLIRFNRRGEFNVPFGKYKKFKVPDLLDLLDIQYRLRSAHICAWEFSKFLELVPSRDPTRSFLYLDPPYIPTSATANFTSYSGAFGLAEHRLLRKYLDWMHNIGAKWMLSNSRTSDTERIFDGYNFHEVSAPRNISCKGKSRGSQIEYVISNY
jgi:DNA adenine methylase